MLDQKNEAESLSVLILSEYFDFGCVRYLLMIPTAPHVRVPTGPLKIRGSFVTGVRRQVFFGIRGG